MISPPEELNSRSQSKLTLNKTERGACRATSAALCGSNTSAVLLQAATNISVTHQDIHELMTAPAVPHS